MNYLDAYQISTSATKSGDEICPDCRFVDTTANGHYCPNEKQETK